MANILILKNSPTPGKIPLATDLEHGELAINTADVILYARDINDNIVAISNGGIGSDPTKVPLDGSVAMTGLLTLSGEPTTDLQAATKKYVDDNAGADPTKVPLDGSVAMTGLLTLAGAPTNSLHAATMQYVDDAIATIPNLDEKVSKIGDEMTGNLEMLQEDGDPDAPGIAFTRLDGGSPVLYGGIGTLGNGNFQIASGPQDNIALVTDTQIRLLIDKDTGWVSLEGNTGQPIALTLNHNTTPKGGFIYDESIDSVEMHGLDGTDLRFLLDGSTKLTIANDTGTVRVHERISCGSVSCISEDTTANNRSTLGGFDAKNYGEVTSVATGVSGNYDINLYNGNVHAITMIGATTFRLVSTHENYSCNMILEGTKNILWPANAYWEGGTAPTLLDNEIDMVLCQVIGSKAFFTYLGNFVGTELPAPTCSTITSATMDGVPHIFGVDGTCISGKLTNSNTAYFTLNSVPDNSHIEILIDYDAGVGVKNATYIYLYEGADPVNSNNFIYANLNGDGPGGSVMAEAWNSTGGALTYSIETGVLAPGIANANVRYTVTITPIT